MYLLGYQSEEVIKAEFVYCLLLPHSSLIDCRNQPLLIINLIVCSCANRLWGQGTSHSQRLGRQTMSRGTGWTRAAFTTARSNKDGWDKGQCKKKEVWLDISNKTRTFGFKNEEKYNRHQFDHDYTLLGGRGGVGRKAIVTAPLYTPTSESAMPSLPRLHSVQPGIQQMCVGTSIWKSLKQEAL